MRSPAPNSRSSPAIAAVRRGPRGRARRGRRPDVVLDARSRPARAWLRKASSSLRSRPGIKRHPEIKAASADGLAGDERRRPPYPRVHELRFRHRLERGGAAERTGRPRRAVAHGVRPRPCDPEFLAEAASAASRSSPDAARTWRRSSTAPSTRRRKRITPVKAIIDGRNDLAFSRRREPVILIDTAYGDALFIDWHVHIHDQVSSASVLAGPMPMTPENVLAAHKLAGLDRTVDQQRGALHAPEVRPGDRGRARELQPLSRQVPRRHPDKLVLMATCVPGGGDECLNASSNAR